MLEFLIFILIIILSEVSLHWAMEYTVFGQDKGYTVKYSPSHEGVPEGKAQGNSQRRRAILDCKVLKYTVFPSTNYFANDSLINLIKKVRILPRENTPSLKELTARKLVMYINVYLEFFVHKI